MTPTECRAARRALGWTQAQLAHAAGVSQPLVSRFECGGYQPVGDGAERMQAAMEAAGAAFSQADKPMEVEPCSW